MNLHVLLCADPSRCGGYWGAIGGRKSAGGLICDEVRMTARSLMEPLERADHARCWFGILLGPQGQCPNRGVYRKPADAFFAFTHWLNGARWCEVHRHDYDVEVDQ